MTIILATFITLLIPVAYAAYVSKTNSDLSETSLDLLNLDILDKIHQLEDSKEQVNFNDLEKSNLHSDWNSEFEAEPNLEELDANPYDIDEEYPELFLPLDDEGHFDAVNPTNVGDHELFEGDMILGDFLTPTDDLAILHDPPNYTDDFSWYRKMSIKTMLRWPEVDGVPTVYYKIHKSAWKIRRIIHDAIGEWTSNTCIRFHELGLSSNRTVLQTEAKLYHVLFVGSLRGCWSVLGHQGWNRRISRQPLSLGKGCKKLRTAIHEIGHALGLVHEQSRSDRDDYIKIIFNNIRKDNRKNFLKRRTMENVPYDFSSIMHYGMSYYTKNGNPTMVPLDPHMFRFLVISNSKLSFRDIKVVNVAYKCIEKWANMSINVQCENEGYIDANGTCVCPFETSGTHCEHSNDQYYSPVMCGGNVTTPTTIQSPNFPQPFPKNSVCTWWIIAPRCQRVHFEIKSFELIKRFRGICRWDFLELRTEDPINPGLRYCQNDLESGAKFLSSGQHFLINFRGMYTTKSGFQAEVTFIPQLNCETNDIDIT